MVVGYNDFCRRGTMTSWQHENHACTSMHVVVSGLVTIRELMIQEAWVCSTGSRADGIVLQLIDNIVISSRPKCFSHIEMKLLGMKIRRYAFLVPWRSVGMAQRKLMWPVFMPNSKQWPCCICCVAVIPEGKSPVCHNESPVKTSDQKSPVPPSKGSQL